MKPSRTGRKLARSPALAQLASHNYVSEHGLASVLRSVKADPTLLEASSRSSIKRARDDAVDIRTPYGALLQRMCIPFDIDDPTCGLEFSYVHPVCMLHHVMKTCVPFRNLVLTRMNETPSSPDRPWTIVLYSDEITCGDPIAPSRDMRKVQAVYWSLKELGALALSSATTWMNLLALRSKHVESIGGLSVLMNYMVDTFYEAGKDVSSGIMIDGDILFMDIKMIIQDYDAVKHMMESKGASAIFPCILCQNAVDHKKPELYRNSDYLVSITELDLTKFRAHTDVSLADT